MSQKRRTLIGHAGFAGAAFATIAFPLVAPGAPGTLAQSPLFLVRAEPPPNIFFVLDDSGSMDSEILKSRGAAAAYPTRAGVFFVAYPVEDDLTQPPARDDQVLELCPGYNVLAYDPNTEYTPWVGENNASPPANFTDRGLTTACDDPYDDSTCTVDLTGHVYFEWNDSDNDGDYDDGECPRPFPTANPYEIPPFVPPRIDSAACTGIPGCVELTASSSSPDKKNYANWYSYYRKREYILKRAVSAIIDDSSARMGMASLHNTGNNATPVSDLTTPANKTTLRQNLFKIDSTSGGATPLLRALDQAGKYFDATDGTGHQYLGAASSPILPAAEGGQCQKNVSVVVSDGFWLDNWPAGFSSYGNEDSDSDAADPGAIASVWDGGSHADTWTDTLADIAMHYYEKDLSPLPNSVETRVSSDDTPNPQQHMVTFTATLGVDGSLTEGPLSRSTAFSWPAPSASDAAKVDDMRHAAWNARGKFLSATRPAAVSAALETVLSTITDATGTEAAVAFNTGTRSSDTRIYQAQLDSADWSGKLFAYDIDAADGSVNTADGAEVWEASAVLDSLTNMQATTSRLVLTRGATDGVVATWGNLTQAQQEDLQTNSTSPGTPYSITVGQARLDHLLGDRGCEVNSADACSFDIDGNLATDAMDKKLRDRGSRLGDIVGGVPVVVGQPALNWPATSPFPDGTGGNPTYSSFKNGAAANRAEIVYVGANDGMLHGFQTSNGAEVLAYMPSNLFDAADTTGYHNLTEPNYVHRYYVDVTPAVGDAFIAFAPGGTAAWRTIAVGGQGAGGMGLYALDITDPTAFTPANAANIVLWEFTSADDDELGYTMSAPVVAMMNNGKWAAIVGSGYNDTGPDPDAHLFIIFLDEGLDGSWTIDTDYIRLEAPEPAATTANRNGMSSPAVADLDGNGTADRVYVGDLFGNLWAFDVCAAVADVCSTSLSDWQNANSAITPLFTAEYTVNVRQPITVKPVISKHPTEIDTTTNQPNVMVYFGTGQYLILDDTGPNTEIQTVYGVWDHGSTARGRGDLEQQTFENGFGDAVVTDNTVSWTSQDGWYLDFPLPGERMVSDPGLRSGILFFNTLLPADAVCANGGTGFQYALDMTNGGRPDFAPFDFNNNGIVDISDDVVTVGGISLLGARVAFAAGIPTASSFIGNKAYTGSSEGTIEVREVFPLNAMETGRISWQELGNF